MPSRESRTHVLKCLARTLSINPDQTAPEEQSDLGLYCLLRPFWLDITENIVAFVAPLGSLIFLVSNRKAGKFPSFFLKNGPVL